MATKPSNYNFYSQPLKRFKGVLVYNRIDRKYRAYVTIASNIEIRFNRGFKNPDTAINYAFSWVCNKVFKDSQPIWIDWKKPEGA